MKRFLQKNTNEVVPMVESEFSMEGLAKMNIRKGLLEKALAFGIALTLTEQAPSAEKKEETPEEAAFRWTFGEEGFAPKWEYDVKHKGTGRSRTGSFGHCRGGLSMAELCSMPRKIGQSSLINC